MQRELTASLGTVGATHVRFLFGFPFALLSLLGVALITGIALPRPNLSYWPWLLVGALAQIAATALMLAAMGGRSFVVVVAYIKTEPIQVAIFGLIFLGDAVSLPMMIAIVIATAGVLVMSYKPGGMTGGIKPTLVGLASGAMFAISAIGYRGAILNVSAGQLRDGGDLHARLRPCAAGRISDRLARAARPCGTRGDRRAWRRSLFAGFMGAFASQFWFLAFAIATAASVRTLALVEVLFAQAISAFIFKQPTSPREGVGMAMIVVGVVVLLWVH